MTLSSRYAGEGSRPPVSTGKVRPMQISRENHPRRAPVFSRKTLPVGAVCMKAHETGNDIPTKTIQS